MEHRKQTVLVLALAAMQADGYGPADLTDDERQVYIDLAILDLKVIEEAINAARKRS
jgi:hypothetical protein